MKNRCAYAFCAALVAGVGSASAADFPLKAPVAAAPVFSWTGAYVGLSVGARWLDGDWRTAGYTDDDGLPIPFASDPNGSFKDVAARFGGYIGYNWQVAPTWVVGLEADIGWAETKDRLAHIPATPLVPANASFAEVKTGWDGSIRGRLGYLITPTVLLFGTGGVAFQHIEALAVCPADNIVCDDSDGTQSGSGSKTTVGWTIGGGIETLWANQWLARVEYRYSEFGSLDFAAMRAVPGTSLGIDARVDATTHIVTFGLARKF